MARATMTIQILAGWRCCASLDQSLGMPRMQARQILLGRDGRPRSARVLRVLRHLQRIVRGAPLLPRVGLGSAAQSLVCCSARRDITGLILMILAMCTGASTTV